VLKGCFIQKPPEGPRFSACLKIRDRSLVEVVIMQTLATSPHFQNVLHQIAALSLEEQLRLIGEISLALRKRIPAATNPIFPHADIVTTVKGKYASIPTSSDQFAQRKAQEIEMER
jgi:hypothetical protein